jgi:hypothetical protein
MLICCINIYDKAIDKYQFYAELTIQMIFMAIIIDFFLLMLMVFEQNNKTTTPVQGSGWVWQSSSN